ncbi:MAG: TraR/DksA C4-type zinc finger protein [bacterium]|nr:TraR/DksA C4-type zinc finger protein [bacterium]
MIKERISRLKARLLGDKDRLEKKLEAVSPANMEANPGDEEGQADEVEEMVGRVALAEVIRRHLRRVKSALSKMQSKTYGICENCGKEIEEKLLEIDPESRYCRECKQRLHG